MSSEVITRNDLQTILNRTLPARTDIVGTVQLYTGITAPTGWLVCNGQAISRTAYSKLFSVISTTYGAGDGSTTFNIPSLTSSVGTYIICASEGGLVYPAIWG